MRNSVARGSVIAALAVVTLTLPACRQAKPAADGWACDTDADCVDGYFCDLVEHTCKKTSDVNGLCKTPDGTYVEPATWYKDLDSDGYADGTSLTQCDRPENYHLAGDLVATSGDCNDDDETTNPGATETVANGIDEDCDGSENCYVDSDLDGYRTPTTVTTTDILCLKAQGHALASAGSVPTGRSASI